MQKRPTVLLSAGMPRSGSTWMFNALRLLLKGYPMVFSRVGSGWIQDLSRLSDNPFILLKLHFHVAPIADCARAIFYSYRDIRDAVASQQRRFGGPAEMAWVDEYVRSHEMWMRCADYTMKYEHMLHDKGGIIADLMETIRIKFMLSPQTGAPASSAAEIVHEIEGMSYDSPGPRNPYYHEVNLFHPDHITDGRAGSWKGSLDPELSAAIMDKYRWWFEKYGYDPIEGNRSTAAAYQVTMA